MKLTRKHIKHKTWGLFDEKGRRLVTGCVKLREHPIFGQIHLGEIRFYE